MRRALLLLLGLGVFGVLVAAASSVSTNDEDVASFSTQTSLTVPTQVLGPTIYVQNGGGGTGTLVLQNPTSQNPARQLIRLSPDPLETQAAMGFYAVWKSPPAPTGGYLLVGSDVVLHIDQNGGNSNRMTVGLLDCPGGAGDASTTAAGCTVIDLTVSDPTGGNGFKEREAHFGPVNYTIPSGRELRLKIVNRTQQPPGTTVSSTDWDVQTGFDPAKKSRLEIIP